MSLRGAGYSRGVRYPVREPFIANTDWSWFEFLTGRADALGRVDEVNFWSPRASRPMKHFEPGDPIFFKLKKPRYAVAGYGFFAAHHVVDLDTCWELFGWKNGDPDKLRFLGRIGEYRRVDLLDPRAERAPVGCTVLRDAMFWPLTRWIPWGDAEGWPRNIVQGRTEHDAARVDRLMAEMMHDERAVPQDLDERYVPLSVDERRLVLAEQVAREGQGAFRLRLLSAYDGRCAITGEHTEPVLDAAHIQPYLGPRSNHIQNGLVLTKEFHALFDRGYVTVTPDYRVRVSERLRADWKNGRRYYPFDGQELASLPARKDQRPSRGALEWHYETVFKRAG